MVAWRSSQFQYPHAYSMGTIKEIIDQQLGPIMGWVSSPTAQKRMKQTVVTDDLGELSKLHPERFAKLVEALKIHIELPAGEENEQLYAAIADLISQFDKASIARVARIVSAMKDEGTANVEALTKCFRMVANSSNLCPTRDKTASCNDRASSRESQQ